MVTEVLFRRWNGALLLAVRAVATALAAGCTVILKASEMCPWTHQFVAETFLEAGFPKGSVNLIVSSRGTAAEITETVISHPRLRKIEFIGSPVMGKAIGAMAAKYLKPTIMELGDQSPLIVLEDADLSKAAQACAQGATLLHGQVCFSTERIIVVSSVKDKFYSLLAEAIDALPSAGFAVSNTFADKAYVAVQDALSRGARVVAGSSQRLGPASMSSSILADVPQGSILSSQEGFAPTAFVVEVENDEEAIAEANSREGGMSAAIFTSSRERAIAVAKELEFGMVQINDMTLAIKRKSTVSLLIFCLLICHASCSEYQGARNLYQRQWMGLCWWEIWNRRVYALQGYHFRRVGSDKEEGEANVSRIGYLA